MFSSYNTLLLLLHLTRNLDTGDVGADTDVGGVSDMSVSSHGDSVSESSRSDNSSVVHVRDNSGGVTVEGLGLSLPLAVDGIYTVVDNWGDSMYSSVGESSNLGQTVSVVNLGDGTSISLASQNLSDGVRLRLRLSLPLSVDYGVGISNVGDSSVREASYSSNP